MKNTPITMCRFTSKKTNAPVGKAFALCAECITKQKVPEGLVLELELDLSMTLKCSECFLIGQRKAGAKTGARGRSA